MIDIITGIFSGIISGMGIGGGAILIPALIIFEQVSQKTAQGINLLYFIPTAVVALIVHIRNRQIEVKTALIIGSFGIIGAVCGSFIAVSLNNDVLKKMFAAFLLIVGINEIYKGIRLKK